MSTQPQAGAGLYGVDGVIAVDHQCKRCAYNLRGLREDGRCPECGAPIGLSTQGDLLCFASPDWVDKLARGLNIIVWMLFLGIIFGALGGLITALVSPVLGRGASLLGGLISYYGVWLLTEPDPGGIGEDPNLTARKLVRLTLVAGLISQALWLLPGAASLTATAAKLVWVLIGLATLVGLVGEFAKFVYYEALARRIPDDALARRARFLKWAFTITLGIVTLGGIAVAVVGAPVFKTFPTTLPAATAATPPPAPPALGVLLPVLMCAMVPVGLALLVFGLMNIAMLFRLRKTIREQARRARATWAAALEPLGA